MTDYHTHQYVDVTEQIKKVLGLSDQVYKGKKIKVCKVCYKVATEPIIRATQ